MLTFDGSKVGRDVIFPHDWLYMTLHSQHGCKFSLKIFFKSDLQGKKKTNTTGGPGASNISGLVNKTLFGSEDAKPDENDEFNFKFFNLGSGTIADKRERLDKYL